VKREVGVRELRAETSSILRRVRKQHASVDITYYGKVVARIVPVEPRVSGGEARDAVWTDIDRLADEIGSQWGPDGMSAADAVSEGRRG
jgi:prevent-host-death family protein